MRPRQTGRTMKSRFERFLVAFVMLLGPLALIAIIVRFLLF
jgi:hypothetical protein